MALANNCADCGCDLTFANADGISGLYNPGPNSFRLCEPCWLDEDDAVGAAGTNVIPERIERYTRNQPSGANS